MIKDTGDNDLISLRGRPVNDTAVTSLRQWTGLKDPRIVRVSRAFGGKDRHSKVRTVRGLRDRRVRLSVPTAIQLYDLQDRLGLNQPSKAVDWLLNAAQHEIDKLPPLQFPAENLFMGDSMSIEASSTHDLITGRSLSLFSNKEHFEDNLGNNMEPSSNLMGNLSNQLVPNSSQMETQIHENHSMLSLAAGSQLVFYPTISQLHSNANTGYDTKELDANYSIGSFGNMQNLTLNSLRHFHHPNDE